MQPMSAITTIIMHANENITITTTALCLFSHKVPSEQRSNIVELY